MGGSAGTEQTDEKENAPEDGETVIAKSADGYTEGIPGPVTRLFVLANRGLANLIQDLILVGFSLRFLSLNELIYFLFTSICSASHKQANEWWTSKHD